MPLRGSTTAVFLPPGALQSSKSTYMHIQETRHDKTRRDETRRLDATRRTRQAQQDTQQDRQQDTQNKTGTARFYHDMHNMASTPHSRSRGSPSCGHGIIPLPHVPPHPPPPDVQVRATSPALPSQPLLCSCHRRSRASSARLLPPPTPHPPFHSAMHLSVGRADREAGAGDAAVRLPDQQSVIRGDALRAFRATVRFAVDRQRVVCALLVRTIW